MHKPKNTELLNLQRRNRPRKEKPWTPRFRQRKGFRSAKSDDDKAAAERQRLFSLLDALPGFVHLIAPDFTIRYANRRFREIFGSAKHSPCYCVMLGRSEPCQHCPAQGVLKSQKEAIWELPLPDGHIYQIYDYPFTDVDSSPLVLELGIDITVRKQAEEENKRHAARSETLDLISKTLAETGLELQSILTKIAHVTAELIGDSCLIKLLAEEGKVLFPAAAHHRNPDADTMLNAIIEAPANVSSLAGIEGEVIRSGKAVVSPKTTVPFVCGLLSHDWLPFIERFGISSLLVVPLRAQGEILGTLTMTRDRSSGPSYNEGDQIFLQDIGDRAALAIANARLFQRMQRESREKNQLERLQKKSEFVEAVVESTAALLLVLNRDCSIVLFNRACEHVTGYLQDEIEGMKLWDLFVYPHEIADAQRAVKDLEKGGELEHKSHIKTKGGQIRTIAWWHNMFSENGDDSYIIASGIDITEQEAAEHELHESIRLSDCLNTITSVIYSNLSFDNIMDRIVVEATVALSCDSAGIALREDGMWVQRYTHQLPSNSIGLRFSDDDSPHAAMAARTGKAVVINDVNVDQRVNRDAMRDFGIQAVMVAPLALKNHTLGVLFFNYHAPHQFARAEMDFANKLAASVSLAVENARLLMAEIEARRQADYELDVSNHLLQAAHLLAISMDLHQVLDSLADIFIGVTRRSRIAIYLLSRDKETLTVMASRGTATSLPSMSSRIDEFLPKFQQSVREGTTITFSADSSISHQEAAIAQEYNIATAIFAPLVFGKEIIGITAIDEPGSMKPFTDRERRLIEGIASQAAVAIQNAVLYDELRDTQQKFQQVSRAYELILESAGEGIIGINTAGNIVFVNKSAAGMLGYPAGELAGINAHSFIHHPKSIGTLQTPDQCKIQMVLRNGETYGVTDEIFWRRDESSFPVEYTATPMREGGAITGAVVIFRDISARKETENALKESEERYRVLVQNANCIILKIDTMGNITFFNEFAESFFSHRRDEIIGKQMVGLLLPEEESEGRDLSKMLKEVIEAPENHGSYECEALKKAGERAWVAWTAKAMFDTAGVMNGILLVGQDITHRRKMEETIKRQASHDSLTRLPNRMLFMDHLNLSLHQAHRYNEIFSVMFLDLDRFKEINDSFGHSVGDKLLQAVAERLKMCVRDSDTVARIGGDEYNILLPQINHAEDAARIARKIISQFKKPFILGEHELVVSTSIGISVFPTDGTDSETLLKNADTALYHVKEHGRNNYEFYNPTMNLKTIERLSLENYLRNALEQGAFTLHYQPQVHLLSGKVRSLEALVRCYHPELGLLEPVRFIPLAEEAGLIVALDEWVLRTACSQNRSWQESGFPPVRVTVNLALRHFQQTNLVERITSILAETKLHPNFLELEVTEQLCSHHSDITVSNITRLTEMGITIAIDEFGTGNSSFVFLKEVPISKVKMHKMYMEGLNAGEGNRRVVNGIIAMAHELKLDVVAKGVETEEQLAFLYHHYCDQAQGYFLGRPVPNEAIGDLLRERVNSR